MRPTSAVLAYEADAATGARGSARVHTAAEGGHRLDYAIVSTRAGFDGLAAEWDALFETAGRGSQLFQGFGWCWHWCNHFLDSEKETLAVVTGRRAGRLVLLWPLLKARSLGIIRLSSLGAPVSQYSDALIEPSPYALEHLRGAWESAVAAVKPDLVCLPRVREDAAIAPLVAQLKTQRRAIATQRLEAPYIDLARAGDLETFMRRHSLHTRKKYRAAARRLARLGDVSFVGQLHGPAASRLAAVALDMKRRQLIERGVLSPAFADPGLWSFFTAAAEGGRHPAGTHVFALMCGDEHVAANITVGGKDCMLGHVFAYDSRYARDSVGGQLLQQTFKRAMELGYSTFDLMAPADGYKMRYADGTVGVVDWAVPLSAKGAVYARLLLMLARPMLKRGLDRLPDGVCRFLARRHYRRT